MAPKVCPNCGAALDSGERCDCEDEEMGDCIENGMLASNDFAEYFAPTCDHCHGEEDTILFEIDGETLCYDCVVKKYGRWI